MSYTYRYPRPAATTDALLICKENDEWFLLLIQRAFNPFQDFWALPGGFVDMDEDLESACARELKEETNIECDKLKQFYTFGAVDRDPRGRTISIVYWCQVNSMVTPKSGDDAANAKWFNINELPALAFDHQIIIEKFISEKLIR